MCDCLSFGWFECCLLGCLLVCSTRWIDLAYVEIYFVDLFTVIVWLAWCFQCFARWYLWFGGLSSGMERIVLLVLLADFLFVFMELLLLLDFWWLFGVCFVAFELLYYLHLGCFCWIGVLRLRGCYLYCFWIGILLLI